MYPHKKVIWYALEVCAEEGRAGIGVTIPDVQYGNRIQATTSLVTYKIYDPDPKSAVYEKLSCCTPDLEALADWLKECQVTSVVMEFTGVYWILLYELLESRGFEVKLVDAHYVKNVIGRKSGVQDCQWLQQLHACGLLKGAFHPADQILPLRSYIRQRDTFIKANATCIQYMQKALTQMNLHLTNVISDITGATGMTIIRAIVAGARDPKQLAAYRDPRCKQSQDIIEKSLTGNYRTEHLFSLSQALEGFDFYQKQIMNCDQHIEHALIQLNPTPWDDHQTSAPIEPRTYKHRGSNTLYFDPSEDLKAITGVDLIHIPGIETNLAVKIRSEIGTDMSRWPSAKHFTSWLGLSPENKVSGGKQLSSRTKTSANRAAEFLRMAALALCRSQTALGGFLRRIKASMV